MQVRRWNGNSKVPSFPDRPLNAAICSINWKMKRTVLSPAIRCRNRYGSKLIARLIHQRLNNDDLITDESASHLEQQIADYLQENPADPKKLSLQIARSNLLYRVDAQKAKSFLEELARDPDQQLAQAARARLTKADLLGKQLDLHFTAPTEATSILHSFAAKSYSSISGLMVSGLRPRVA